MLHFHCRKCAKNILTEDGKDKPTFTDGLCDACNPEKQPAVFEPDPRDAVIANLEAQVVLLSQEKTEPEEVGTTEAPLYVSNKPSKPKKPKREE